MSEGGDQVERMRKEKERLLQALDFTSMTIHEKTNAQKNMQSDERRLS
jgi:hypothetical protein